MRLFVDNCAMNFNTALYTDLYQLSMGQSYFMHNRHNTTATFDYFFRKSPFNGGYVIFCGLEIVLDWLEQLHFSEEDLNYLKEQGFKTEYLNFLKDFKFSGQLKSVEEGNVVFPFAPIVSVSGTILECQIVETYLLNTLNFQSLIATKASRMRYVAGSEAILSEFGLRRAQSYAGLMASRASIVGGFNSTSNVIAGKTFNIPISGTMSHAFVQSYGDELKAFRAYAETYPENCILLVDTYNTLDSGIPNAILVAKELEEKGHQLVAIRLDSGDLNYLSNKTRQLLDNANLHYVKIAASNQLDENVIRSLKEQQAVIDIYGIGTNLVVGRDNAALDGVFKLCSFDDEPRIKISENLKKMNFPGSKQVFRYVNSQGQYSADVITLDNLEAPTRMTHPFEPHKSISLKPVNALPLLHVVMQNGKRTISKQPTMTIAEKAKSFLSKLPPEHKRFDFPHEYKVGLSLEVSALRELLKNKQG
ncbi:nicotinate phosphoribosyltransferase [Mangrovimonas aestuarii]|uniref:nicotinate phosphoribosyltransferase n=1 Tax=Mangrovimonas aestuarii TaxID=3018443 RepID=UPI002377D618|nr:nicotinate phosphoribosyltransferase [Mangrovimonas aestuarii]